MPATIVFRLHTWGICAVLGMLLLSGCDAPKAPAPPVTPPAVDLGGQEDSSNTMPPVQPPEPTPETPPDMPATPPATKEPMPETKPPTEAAATSAWKSLFDGKTLTGWKSIEFGGEGEVTVEDGKIVMQRGSDLTGVVYAGDALQKVNYEITFEAQRIDGLDFFCGLVFPHKEEFCSFVVGGWGGGVVGLSSVDGNYANENSTGSNSVFKSEQWYRIRLRVGDNFVRAWIDDKNVVDLDLTGHQLSVHPAVDLAKPLGITCYSTIAGLRDIHYRTLTEEEAAGLETDPPAIKVTKPAATE